ncbi:MAG: 23S rRNA (guanosine(2251)-2'-O)-methyltransferase RlmB [Elusimicrobia bacterium]|nr:23S rRNA (guanosine(2251)-2'-O)-methyltransferase RlmB [Elusimicrobiota bacterium]
MRSPGRGRTRGAPPSPSLWLGGVHAVEETLRSKAGSCLALWVEHRCQNPAIAVIIRLAREKSVAVQFVPRREMDKMVREGRHQGVALKVSRQESRDLLSFVETLREEARRNLVLVALDQIQDPHNLGAIARSAVNLGAGGLILPERRSAPVTPVVVQASAGAVQRLPIFQVVNLAQSLARLKEAGFWIYGADMAGRPSWQASLNRPLVLVIGSEGEGLRPLVRQSCDELISIPQAAAGVASLNASCAASVLLYEIARQAAHPHAR